MRDLHAEITDRIVARLKEGVVPWRKPWTNGMPRNAVTGRLYSGVNILLLQMQAGACDYASPCWLTFKQALEAGGNVRKGEHGEMVIFVSQISKAGDDDEERRRSFLKAYTVFNVGQCDGLPGKVTKGESGRRADPKRRDELADAFLRITGAVIIHGGSRASYAGYADCIRLPAFAWFESADLYYSTVFHELAHWSGNERRLKWDFAKRFGDSAYSVEELAALS